jgi:hypothetical protein
MLGMCPCCLHQNAINKNTRKQQQEGIIKEEK